MKLLSYNYQETQSLGALVDDKVVDLGVAHAALQMSGDLPLEMPVADFPVDILTFLQGGDVMWEAAITTLDWAISTAPERRKERFIRSLSEIHLCPPLRDPSKIIGVGLNYYDHCYEQDLEIPKSPTLFAKFPSAIIGPEESITWPPDTSDQVDYEVELAVVIKRQARNISADEWEDYIAGYMILNDVSARDVQFGDGQWVRGKSFDTFCPIGPYLVSPDEVGDPYNLDLKCWVNGELLQDSNTAQMIFTIPDLLTFISSACTLLPGDIITTGTPDGVGVFQEPPVFLEPGDIVELEIEHLGRLRSSVG